VGDLGQVRFRDLVGLGDLGRGAQALAVLAE
jgi:hypothetical protein